MLAALKKQAGKSFTPSQYMAYGYWMADMFIAMLKKVGPNLTRATFMAATKNFVYHVPGGTGVVAFPAARNAPSPCSAAVQIVGSKFVTKLPLQCYSNVPLPK
jgi:ABC-type branched-subunit amino acid transport system substrate-binding protein